MLCRSDFASSLTVKSVALFLESAKRAQDYKIGAMICQKLWKSACNIKVCFTKNFAILLFHFCLYCQFESVLDAPDTHSYLLRAINAAIHLQVLVLKQRKMSRQEIYKLKKYNEIAGTASFAGNLSLAEELKRRKGWFIEDELQAFVAQDFYKILKDNSLIPDRHTYEVIINYVMCAGLLVFVAYDIRRRAHMLLTVFVLM